MALLIHLSGQTGLNGGAVAVRVVQIAHAKQELSWQAAFFRGVMCNVRVCLAVWMAMAGRSVIDKAVAIVPPIATFVAAGFEHSVANLFFFPLALLVQAGHAEPGTAVTVADMFGNLVPVIAGNLVGGSVLVGLTYHLICRRGIGAPSAAAGEAPPPDRRG